MSEPILSFEQVTRRFGRKTALSDVTLTVAPGTVLGLVGSNGAGKSTALRLANGVLWPDAGTIRVLGLDPVTDGLAVRTRVGLLSEESALYPWMTVGEITRFGAAIHPRWDPSLARSFGERLALDPAAKIRSLSRGTKAKVALLLAVACRPDLLLLDDPTAGLDPLVRREVLEGILEAIPGEGGAVVYASHMVNDIERLADVVAILDAGRLTAWTALDALKARICRVVGVFDGAPPDRLDAPGSLDVVRDGRTLAVIADAPAEALIAALRAVGAREVRVDALGLEEILIAWLRRAQSGAPVHNEEAVAQSAVAYEVSR